MLKTEKGGNVKLTDEESKTPIDYAVHENNYETVQTIKDFLFEQKLEERKKLILQKTTTKPTRLNENYLTVPQQHNLLASVQQLEESKYTPNRINYNFDVTSPYYINITHRRKKPIQKQVTSILEETDMEKCIEIPVIEVQEIRQNIFELTKENVDQFSKEMTNGGARKSFINCWRDKINKSKSKNSLLSRIESFDEFFSIENISILTSTLKATELDTDEIISINESFKTACEALDFDDPTLVKQPTIVDNFDQSNFIKSPSKDADCLVQMAETYVHNVGDMVFYEQKLLATVQNVKETDLNSSQSSVSTAFTIPLDYDTDALRAELTMFGENPGPITKSTKKLYMKRLLKIKRNPEKYLPQVNEDNKDPIFSIELHKTLKNPTWYKDVQDFFDLEAQMVQQFPPGKKYREGNLKTSFIYLLIDPRISDNLPGQSRFITKEECWRRFLNSIFYVGKGKSGRPYSHLYDAMKFFSQQNNCLPFFPLSKPGETPLEDKILFKTPDYLIKSKKSVARAARYLSPTTSNKQLGESKKLEKIINVWEAGYGVVCLHVFHNIIPVEAYTREASIIDCIGLSHLTNMKRGDYYGAPLTWPQKSRKHLGIGLLYKAMLIHLAEGESQLMPGDLI